MIPQPYHLGVPSDSGQRQSIRPQREAYERAESEDTGQPRQEDQKRPAAEGPIELTIRIEDPSGRPCENAQEHQPHENHDAAHAQHHGAKYFGKERRQCDQHDIEYKSHRHGDQEGRINLHARTPFTLQFIATPRAKTGMPLVFLVAVPVLSAARALNLNHGRTSLEVALTARFCAVIPLAQDSLICLSVFAQGICERSETWGDRGAARRAG